MPIKTTPTLALAVAVLLVTAGQIFLKQAVLRHPFARPSDLVPLLFSPWALAGLATYGLGTVFWLYGLAHLPFYLVTFFMVLPLALLLVAAFVLFGERPTTIQWVGIGAVTAGVVLVTYKT